MDNLTDKAIIDLVQQHLVQDNSSDRSGSNNTDATISIPDPDNAPPSITASAENNGILSSSPVKSGTPVPYHLPGAAITHDIYTHANSLLQSSQCMTRSRSVGDIKQKASSLLIQEEEDAGGSSNTTSVCDDANEAFENLDKPGGFRRFHIHQQHKLLHKQHLEEAGEDQIPESEANPAFTELFRPDSLISLESRQMYTPGLIHVDIPNSNNNNASSSSASYVHSSPHFHPQQQMTRHFLEYLAITSYFNQFAGENLSDTEEDEEDEEEGDLEQQITERTELLPNKRISVKRHQSFKKEQQKAENKADVTKTFFLLFKAFIGSGILFLPKAFSNGGLVFSIFIMWLMGGVSLYCFLLLLDCKNYVTGSYGDIGGELYGPYMRAIVLFSIAISQLGFMCGGAIFIVQNIVEAVRSLSDNTIHLNDAAVFIMLALLTMPLVLVRNISKLSLTALISDVLIIGGLLALLVFDFVEIFEDGFTQPTAGPGIQWLFNSAHYSVFIGTAVYSFEGIGLIIPIRDSMQQPEKFSAVLTIVMILVASTLCTVGTLGYLAFGENVQTVALLNLPPGLLPSTIQLGYATAVLLSNALTLFPTIRIIEQTMFGERTGKHSLYIKWQKNTLRIIVVVVGTMIAYIGANDLDKFISLIGSVCCCPLSLIFPPLFHLALPSAKGAKRLIDVVLVGFGLVVMIFTFFNTSKQWATLG
ncbi:transmembrane amino acid transporter protein-domain-containing protein [Mycotypha africana]|uniref:transmembrane amino acid transporter protein-domain-containing protein n=1 Tax=Mycotypha africana TaxID=64632 RepID=UPI0023011A72|nr:transmembrane amino acid transporter protein-domain-containing protein [Mycotypha africana]KAI8979169.1 transmembrane amino acid transporter protein-domain-containing protein [Mycotypha africana]